MHRHRTGAGAHKALGAWGLISMALYAMGPAPALAQAQPAASAPASDAAPSEAARRQALGPFRFILQHASAPAKPKPPAATAEPKRPVTVPPAEQSAAIVPQAPAPAPVITPAPAPVEAAPPAPVTAAKAPESAPAVRVLKPLVAIKQDPPVLTGALLRERPEGTVKIGFDINPDGSTGSVKVLSSTNRRLNNAALEAVFGWRFQPIDDVRPTEIELVFSNQ